MKYTVEGLDSLRTVDGLVAHRGEVQARITELDNEAKGLPFTDEQRDEFAELADVRKAIDTRVAELNARAAIVAASARDDRKLELAVPNVARKSRIPENVHDVAEYRRFAPSLDALPALYTEGAKHYLDGIDTDKAHQLDAMLAKVNEEKPGTLALRYLECSGPTYERAFEKYMKGLGLTVAEQAAMGTYSNAGADGGFAVPVTLDPSLIPTNDIQVTDIRSIARIVSITGKEWQGVTSGGITASRVGENVAVTPTSPTLAQPRVVPSAVKVAIPFSIEVEGDWGQLQSELSREIAEAKSNEEATTFTNGAGNGVTAPEGITHLDVPTSVVWTQATGNFGVEDIYAVETDTETGASGNPLPNRFRKRASFLANKSIYNKIRQLSVGTVGEGSIWLRGLTGDRPPELIGYPAYEDSLMDGAVADGNDVLILGDFNYFLIVDRVGMSVELVPHMVDGSGNLLGQRALFAYWRNGSKILSSNAFRMLRVGAEV